MSNQETKYGARQLETAAVSPAGRLLMLLLGVLLTGTVAMAGTVPYAESFEPFADGYDINLQSDWGVGPLATVVVSTDAGVINLETNYATGGKSFPLNTTHAKVLQVTGDASNEVSSATDTIVVLDYMILPSHRSTVPAATADQQLGLYLDMSGNPNIWHRNLTGPANEWITLTNSPSGSSSEWHRVRISLDYVNDMFRVAINEGDPIQDGRGYAFGGGSQPGEWFHMVQTNGSMTRVSLDGTKTYYIDDLVVSNRSVSYSATAFNESTNNNGSINNSSPVIITLGNDTFTGSNGENFVAGGELTVGNLPAGLTAVAERTSDTTLSVTMTGTATSHANADDVSNLTFTFADGACTLGNAIDVTGYSRSDLVVDFFDAPIVTYASTSFTESGANDGSIAAGTTLSVGGRTFAGASGTNYVAGGEVSVSGVPSGLTVSITRNSASAATLAFSGNAAPHASSESTSSMEIIFNDSAFVEGAASGVSGYSNGTLSVTFYDPFTLTYSKATFSELSEGRIDNTDPVVITLAGDTYAAGTDFVSEGKIVVANLSAGLAAVATRTGGTTLSVTLTGTATAHADANDVSNLTFTFQNSAFANATATAVSNYDKSDLAIDYNDLTVTINAVPYEESFESYSDGFQIVGTNGWQGLQSYSGTVTSKADVVSALSAYSGSGFPIDSAAHDQVLSVTADITDEIKSGSGGDVYIDLMFLSSIRDNAPSVNTNYQFAFFVDTNGTLNIQHHNKSGGPGVNEWMALSGSPTITSNAWIRLTVQQDYANQMFQVAVDEDDFISDSDGWTEGGGTPSGPWFFMVNSNNNYMSRLGMLEGGVSYLEDITVRATAPEFLSASTTTIIYFE
jgi:hypothetical protein